MVHFALLSYNRNEMRRGLLHALAVTALLLILGGHITDQFGWDHEFQTGREIDYTVVFVAACGAAVFLALAAVRLLSRPSRNPLESPTVEALMVVWFLPAPSLPSPSPPALRI